MSNVSDGSPPVPAANGVRFSVGKLRSEGRVTPTPSAPLGFALVCGRVLLVSALLLSVAMRGAVSPVTLLMTVLLVGIALFLGALAPPSELRTLRSYRLSMAVATLIVLFLLLQAWSVPGNPFAHPLWSRADRLLGGGVAAASVSPAATRDAGFTLVAPFLFYSAGLALFQRDEGGLLLMRWLAALGIAFAVFGLLQIGLFPDRLLLVAKTAYLDSLTGTFVNRNTAGTFLGVSGFAILTLAVSPVSDRRGAGPLFAVLADPGAPTRRRLWAGIILLGLFSVFLALFLTRSRGALLATMVAVTVVFVVFALRGSGRRWRRRAGARFDAMGKGQRIALALAVPVIVLLVVAVFGGLAIQRMEARGVDEVRLCVYWSTLNAIGQNWTLGTGFGTFQSIFPLYRSPDCGAARDVFLRAHNTYLEGMLGLGILFVPLLLGGFIHILRNLYQGVLRRRRMRAVSIAAIGAVILVALHALVDFSLQIPGMAAFFAVYLAAATTVSLARGEASPAARS